MKVPTDNIINIATSVMKCCKTKNIMEKRDFLSYEAPEVEIIEVEVEKGFAVTNEETGNEDW